MSRPLTATFVKNVKRPGAYGDGRGGYGLTLRVRRTASGRSSKVWVQRLRIDGRPTNVGLGAYPLVSLREARDAAFENSRAVTHGMDPRSPGTPTVDDALEAVIAAHSAGWKDGGRSAQIWRASIANHAGALLPRRVDKITTGDVMGCLLPIWATKHDTAKKVRQRLSVVFRWAIAEGHRFDDPAGEAVLAALPRHGREASRMAALPPAEVPAALDAIDASGAYPTTKLVLGFLAATATRSGEARGARWSEIDDDTWTIPGERTKTGRAFRVPLSPMALEALNAARAYADGSGLIFASAAGRQISAAALSKLCHELDLGMTPHGLRSSFRDWCAETGVARELAEACLAHVVANPVEAAYRRSDLLDQRRVVMAGWSNFVTRARSSVELPPDYGACGSERAGGHSPARRAVRPDSRHAR